MNLELHIAKIRDVRFGKGTGIQDGVLTVDKAELRKFLERDRRFGRVDVELARPGESCRIFQVMDVIEPRAKIGMDPDDLLNLPKLPLHTGEGKTRVLRGAAVVMVDNRTKENTAGTGVRDQIIDMCGPASEVSTYGKTFNIVLLPQQAGRSNVLEYQAALKIAGVKAAAYLASAAEGAEPDEIETYDLPALTETAKGMPDLPKIVYIAQIISLQYQPIPGEPTFFGAQAEGIIPTLVHPNHFLDGAVNSPFPNLNTQTYQIQNHPVIKELYRRHGKDLCFCGVIATLAPNNVSDLDSMAKTAAGIAKWVVGADGAILTKTGGGAPELALGKTAQRCEQLGIKTVIAMLHMGADVRDTKYGASTIFSLPEVDAMISMGFPSMPLQLPRVEKVIGSPDFISEETPINGETIKVIGSIYGTLCQMGSSKFTAVRY